MKTQLSRLFTSIILILFICFSSCTISTSSSDDDENDHKYRSSEDVEIIEKSNQEKVDGQVVQVTSKTIKKAKADFVDVVIKVLYGQFYVNDGNNNFVDAEFIYDKYDLKPVMKYNEDNKRGDLLIKLTGDDDNNIDIDTDNDETKCLVELSNDIPMDLRLELGAGRGKFNLNELQLEDLEMRLGAGEFDINLSGSNVKSVDIEAGVGSVELDLSGKHKNDLYVEILGGFGELDIKLPSDIGARVEIKGILGDIDAYGFKKRDRIYTNEAYGRSEKTIEIDVRAGMGDVNLILVD